MRMHAMAKPVGEVARSATLLLRVMPDERERFHAAAAREGMTLSDWLRGMADERAKQTGTRGQR